MTTGATGGGGDKRQTDGEEARGEERNARAGKLHWRARISDRGISEGGKRGGPEPSGGREHIT